MSRRFAGLQGLALAAGVAAITVACATNPATGKKEFNLMSEAQEVALGKESDPQIRQEMGVVNDPELQRYVDGIGRRLASATERPQLPWSFAIVDAPAVNAFAVPGGFVYVTRGILGHLNSEAELAGVLGHEIAHVTARHSAAQYSKQTAGSLGLLLGQIFVPELRPFGQAAEAGLGLLFLKFGRDDELQADELGAGYATAQGWDPRGVASMLETLGRLDEGSDRKGVPNWMSTHPMPADRVARLDARVAALRAQAGGRELAVNRAAYLDRIDGLMFGDNPREGVLRGNAFLHPDLGFRMTFPEGWQVQNTPQQVVAQPQGGGGYVFLQLVQQPQGASLRDVAAADLGQTGLQYLEGGETRVNGLPAFIATFRGQLQDQGEVVLRAAWIAHAQKVFRVAGLASAANAQAIARAVDGTVRSFEPLSRGEAERIRPNVITLQTAQAGDTWERLASGPGRGLVPARTLAVINGYTLQEPPRAGERIKIVVEQR
ncbi:peptidase M48 [Luteitalea sp. TBR-22]|uniref:M48 family metalloprotease n=1 Tax=Luteitalea sp. TBR-22 TaxID=2802971 RepID=UPI001AF9DA0D|nr:M48 family metalloprotease [Luteitalea sp. TBR-22]BCS35265.1 peptidase M48 [Luteitalea sp. TBR-22]